MSTDIETERPKPNGLVAGFALLVACQLAGEVGVGLLRQLWPAVVFPGPVAGMLLLLAILLLRPRPYGNVLAVANGLLGVLSLLFVPSAVGIIQHGEIIRAWGLPLLLAVLVSTLLTLLATVGTYLLVERLMEKGKS